jgi:hypothetical protein
MNISAWTYFSVYTVTRKRTGQPRYLVRFKVRKKAISVFTESSWNIPPPPSLIWKV